jgi:hypothetical protein
MASRVDEVLAKFRASLGKQELKRFDEFQVMLAVLAVEDPVERWKALGREISKRWPKGVSAVKAIREERG